MAGMDHSNMNMSTPGTTRGATVQRTSPAGGMDHSNMPGMQAAQGMQGSARAATTPMTPKLDTLIAELVQDSVVRRRIQADTALRRLWANPEVRRILQQRP
jgi:hypothetical protein